MRGSPRDHASKHGEDFWEETEGRRELDSETRAPSTGQYKTLPRALVSWSQSNITYGSANGGLPRASHHGAFDEYTDWGHDATTDAVQI